MRKGVARLAQNSRRYPRTELMRPGAGHCRNQGETIGTFRHIIDDVFPRDRSEATWTREGGGRRSGAEPAAR